MDELRKIFNIARTFAETTFREDKDHEVLPHWHAISGTGENLIIATPWQGDEDKEAMIAMLRKMFAKEKVQRFAFVCEAWVTRITPANAATAHIRPMHHPDRREVLRILAEDIDGQQLSGQFYILRPEHGPPTLSPFEENTDYMAISGRMTGLLKMRKART